ncbi:hypothetical protein ZOSMA_99G00460 [Zostera marina]|uniref:Uncharacterized protein n=1 Tax=Zostera marina TaxID=29655 RepID=A0A0K9NJI8_ZOSMR|nr:hypothetical protein ZOSMA_99G00460 [Zostera marina]
MYSFTEDEMYVAEIMRNLHKLFRKFRRRVPCYKAVWRTKKKRSSVNRKPNHIYSRLPSFSSSSPPQQPTPMEPEPELETMASAGLCTKPNTKASSPSTPLCFYPSAGENTDDKSGVASASPRRSKRIKIQNKEWIREQNTAISLLSEEKRNLQQEAEDVRMRYESLFLKNTQLKELKKKMKEKEQKEAVEADRNCFDEQRCRRRKPFVFQSTMVPTPTMDPTVPTNITRSQLLPAQPEAPTATPLPPTHDHHHYHPAKNVSPQFWSVSGGESWTCHTGLPDLNATVDESGFVVMDKTPMVVVMDQRRWPDAKKLATTEARKKRIEINRRKGTSAVASHRIGASSNDR